MNPILNFYYGEIEDIEGMFSCEYCGVSSGKAKWHPKTQLLFWKCPSCKERNEVEDMDLNDE